MIVLLVSLAGSFTLKGQSTGCTDRRCISNVLNISTGFNQSTSTYQTPLSLEPTWQLVGVPASSAITLPAPAWVIAPNPAWSNCPNAQWISPFQNNSYNTNNPPPDAPFEFRNCFCLCQRTRVAIKFDMLVDDAAYVYVDGILIGTAFSGYQFQWPKRLSVDTVLTLSEGTHCLRVELFNLSAVAMGFALEGTITGANMLSSICCNPTGRICGTKVNDINCDGVIDPSVDPGLPGWSIVLLDGSGNPIDTQVTDTYGNYCFDPLRPGTYTVAEINQPGWVQTYPSGGTYTITVTPGSANTANFANCQRIIPEPCEVRFDFDAKISNCQAAFFSSIGALPAGYQIISTEWTFGDGYSSTEANPVHFYRAGGSYKACLSVTLFNGTECCTRTLCKEIIIERPCEGRCRIDAEIEMVRNGFSCTFDFTGTVLATGVPVTTWLWDFGDGTTGTGAHISHQYATGGRYRVCLTLFSQSYDGCCFVTICRDISVRCLSTAEPVEGAKVGGTQGSNVKPEAQTKTESTVKLTDKNVIVLNQNVPNPFAESTVITYNIPSPFNKAQIVFTTSTGKTIKAVDIVTRGEGQLNIFADDLTTGVYMYTLIVDGKTIESKSMIKD